MEYKRAADTEIRARGFALEAKISKKDDDAYVPSIVALCKSTNTVFVLSDNTLRRFLLSSIGTKPWQRGECNASQAPAYTNDRF